MAGRWVAQQTRLVWVIAEDGAGSDLALHGQRGDVLLYPTGSVARRLTSDEPRVLERMHEALSDEVRRAEAAAAPPV